MEDIGPRAEGQNSGVNRVEEEIPLEIEDFSCNTYFEEVVMEIEHYLAEEFRTHPTLRQFLNGDSDSPAETKPGSSVVLGRSFTIGQRGEGGISVEIHMDDTRHPITRLFAVPFFFLARGTTTASSYSETESSYYLSLLTTAVGEAMRSGHIAVRLHSDPSPLLSPFFYASGTVPCFVAVGDHYQLAFAGASPPVLLVAGKEKDRARGLSLRRLIAQPIIQTRFQCSAYSQPPEWCQSVGDYLDMFQLQIGPLSRVRNDFFDGICVSVQRTFCLKVPRRFALGRTDPRVDALGHPRDGSIMWHTILEIENETMLLSAGPSTFRFGTGTGPLRGIHFAFRWNQLQDMDVHEDGNRSSNLNPFSAVSRSFKEMLTIKATAISKKECELSHATCEGPSGYAYMVMEYIEATANASYDGKRSPIASLEALADEIISSRVVSISNQQALVDRIARHHAKNGIGAAAADIRHVYFPGSLLCRFAYICATRLEVAADVHTLWLLVVYRLKELLEGRGDQRHSLLLLIETIGVPVVDEIDHGLPLLVQKLKLLAYCAHRMLRDGHSPVVRTSVDGWEDAVCEVQDMHSVRGASTTIKKSADNTTEDVGSAPPIKRLITNGEELVVPQEIPSPPCTTDMLLQQAQALQNLGTGGVAQSARAWVQSDRLLNDMCAFLYANLAHKGRVVRFPDFVHWYSPRDFVAKPETGVERKHKNMRCGDDDDNDNDNDDIYLSVRMQRRSNDGSANVWWTLWSQATPQSPDEIIAQSFVPHAQARLIILWLERDLPSTALLLESINANLCNSLHRMLSHRCFSNNSAMASYALKKCKEVTNGIKDTSLLLTLDDASKTIVGTENVRVVHSTAIRRIGEVETCLCASLIIERMLGQESREVEPPSGNELCTSTEQLAVALASPAVEQNDVTGLTLRETGLTWDVWQMGGISQRFPADCQQPVETRVRATCMAERPLSTTACFQQMILETDEEGVFRVAFSLAEEVL